MTGKVVNLSRVRKSRARDEQRKEADANAAKFGRSKAERRAEDTARAKDTAHLDAHQRDD